MNDPLTDQAEIRRALEMLVEPGSVFELRAWGCLQRYKKGVISGYFDDMDKASAAAALLSQGGMLGEIGRTVPSSGVYIVLNPVDPALLARSANHLRVAESGDTTGDQHIARRRWILVDCDPVRASGISSSDAEKALAQEKAKEIGRVLREEMAFPAPVLADSGNGWHLLYRVDMAAQDNPSQFLKALAKRFDSESVHVDQKVFNSSRISKLYGTGARKGDSTADRPHRLSRIEYIPEPLEITTQENLDAAVAMWMPPEDARPRATRPPDNSPPRPPVQPSTGGMGHFPMEEFIGRHMLDAGIAIPYKGGSKWQITCPFDSSHAKPDAALYVTGDGRPGFACSHSSCQGRDMRALAGHLRDENVLARFKKAGTGIEHVFSTEHFEYFEKVSPNSEYINNSSSSRQYLPSKATNTQNTQNASFKQMFDEWGEIPVSFGQDDLPLFPSWCLPPVLRNFAEQVAASVGTAADLPGVQVLAAIAASTQKRVKVRGKPGHEEPMTLWCIGIAPPGSRKSAIMAHIRKPFTMAEARDNESRRPDVDRYESQERVAKARLTRAESAAAKGNPSIDAQAELDTARHNVSEMKPVRTLRLLADDATPEVLALMLSENDGRLAVLDAEGAAFGHMIGRYSQNPALEIYLKGHAGEDHTTDRAGGAGTARRTVFVSQAALTIGCAVQPEVLADLRKKRELAGRGALARCLFSFSEDTDAADEYDTPDIPGDVLVMYRRLIEDLLTLSPSIDNDDNGQPIPHVIDLSDGARALFAYSYREAQTERRDEGGGLYAEWLAKLHGATLRISGVLHMAKHGRIGAELLIDSETMASAIELGKYFSGHARVALARIRENEAVDGAIRILGWVKRNKDRALKLTEENGGVSLRDIRQMLRTFETNEELEASLYVLASRGYAREVQMPDREQGSTGRKPTPRWQFHPSLTVAS